MSASSPDQNLLRLTNALRDWANAIPACTKRLSTPPPAAAYWAREMPLGHATGTAGLQGCIRNAALLSKHQLSERKLRPLAPTGADRVETELGTADAVFTFAGPLRYPGVCGLLFAPSVETTAPAARATPFDSGGLVSQFFPHEAPEYRRDFLARHQLPVPGYRSYLELVLVTLFAEPARYLDGGPDHRGPIGLSGGDARRWTFEVAFPSELSIQSRLLAAFVPFAVATTTWASPWIEQMAADGVTLRFYRADPPEGRRLLDESIAFLRAHL